MTLQKRALTAPATVSIGGTIAVPAGVQAGDFVLAWFSCPSGTPREQSVMDGWHSLGPARAYDSVYLFTYYRISNGSEPATYTTDFTNGMTGAMFVVYSDASAHVQLDAIARDIRASSTSTVFPSVTFSASGMLLNFGCGDSTQANTPPGGSTEEVDGPTLTTGRLYLMRENISGAGSTGTRTATAAGAQSSELLSFALIDAAFVYPTGPVLRSTLVKGQQNTVTTYSINAPPNLKAGDLMVLHVAFQTSSPTFTVSDGGGNAWSAIASGEVTGSNSVHTFQKVAVAGDIGSSYTLSWSGTKTSDAAIAAYYAPSGNALQIDAVATQTNASATNLPFPSLTTLYDKSLVLWMETNDITNSATWDTSATYGQPHYQTGTNFRVRLFTEYVPTAGATGTRTATVGGTSSNSKMVAVALSEVTIPATPGTLTATGASASQINLAWSDDSSTETGYKVEQSANGTTGWSLIHTTAANATSYSVTGLSAGTTYYFRVYAYNVSGNSAYSNVAHDMTWPATPGNVAATALSDSSIQVTWDAISPTPDGYSIERSANGTTGWSEVATSAGSFTNNLLSEHTTYYYRVRAYVGPVYSAYSSTVNATTLYSFHAPASFTATALSPRRIQLTWTDDNSVAHGNQELGTIIERSADGATGWTIIGTAAADATSYTDTLLDPETTYYYRARMYK